MFQPKPTSISKSFIFNLNYHSFNSPRGLEKDLNNHQQYNSLGPYLH